MRYNKQAKLTKSRT